MDSASPSKNEWRDSTGKPEELVRQRWIRHLCESFGYSLNQMKQEQRTFSGTRSPKGRYRCMGKCLQKGDRRKRRFGPVLVVECKAESVEINLKTTIRVKVTHVGSRREFFTHNSR